MNVQPAPSFDGFIDDCQRTLLEMLTEKQPTDFPPFIWIASPHIEAATGHKHLLTWYEEREMEDAVAVAGLSRQDTRRWWMLGGGLARAGLADKLGHLPTAVGIINDVHYGLERDGRECEGVLVDFAGRPDEHRTFLLTARTQGGRLTEFAFVEISATDEADEEVHEESPGRMFLAGFSQTLLALRADDGHETILSN